MTNLDIENNDVVGMRFCPNCGHEGTDLECPVCHIPMESLEDEVNRIGKLEEKSKDIFAEVSLESEQDKEEIKEKSDAETEDL